RERLGRARLDEQAVGAVGDDLSDPTDAGGDHRRSDREAFDQRMWEVLPARREQLPVRGGEQLEDGLAWLSAEEAHAIAEPELRDESVQPATLRPVAGEHQPDAVARRHRPEGDVERLLRREATCERAR